VQNERQRVNLLSVVSKPTLAMRRPNPHALGRGSGTEHERRTRRVGGGGVSPALTLAWRCLLPWGDGRRGPKGQRGEPLERPPKGVSRTRLGGRGTLGVGAPWDPDGDPEGQERGAPVVSRLPVSPPRIFFPKWTP